LPRKAPSRMLVIRTSSVSPRPRRAGQERDLDERADPQHTDRLAQLDVVDAGAPPHLLNRVVA